MYQNNYRNYNMNQDVQPNYGVLANPYEQMRISENYLPGYAHGGHIYDDPEDDYYDYHQEVDYDDYDEAGHMYPHYYNDLIRDHYASGGTAASLAAKLRSSASSAHKYIKPVLDRISSGARYAGSQAARLGRNIASGASYAGRQMYNRLPSNPFRRSAASNSAAKPRTWADTFGDAGRWIGHGAGYYGGHLVGAGAGTVAGPAIARGVANAAFPLMPGMIRNPLAGGLGGLVGMPLGSFVGRQVGQRVGGRMGEGVGRMAGRGIDYASERIAPTMQAARQAASDFSNRVSPYTQPISQVAQRGASMFGNGLAAINPYTPAGLANEALARNPEFFRPQSPKQTWGVGMPGYNSEREPLLAQYRHIEQPD